MTRQLEALEERPQIEDRIGFRCQNRYEGLGTCDLRQGHETTTDGWHYCMTDYDPPHSLGQHWRWKDT